MQARMKVIASCCMALSLTGGAAYTTLTLTPGEARAQATSLQATQQAVKTVTVAPRSPSIEEGRMVQLTATARDSTGTTVTRNFTWMSENPAIAEVDANGLVRGKRAGTTRVGALADGVAGGTWVRITPAAVAPLPPPGAGPRESWDQVLANTTIQGDVVVPDGERWLIGPNVQIAGNLRTAGGTIALRPGSSLQFIGGDPRKYVGGGMHYMPQFANDIGLWVGGHGASGMLDIACSPTTSWNRTGSDPSWSPNDEYWIAPVARGDYTVRRWTPDQPVPKADPRVPAAEVANVTRDCTIEGPGHIHIHSSRAQRIEYVRLQNMGVTIPGREDSGRYAIHLHMMGDGARGTVIRGVAAVNSRGRVFVPHASHGVLLEDNVTVGSWAESLWWDHNNAGDRSHDVLVQRLLVLGTFMPRELSTAIKPKAIVLGSGDRNIMRRSAVSGMTYYEHARGFAWHANGDDFGPDVWTLEDNVAHNNRGHGLRIYNTDPLPHVIEQFIAYRNGGPGIESGGYASANRYMDMLLLDNALSHHSNSRTLPDGTPGSFRNLVIESRSGPAIDVTKLSIRSNPNARWEFIGCQLTPGPGFPKVRVRSSSVNHPWRALFRNCGMTPADIEWTDYTTGSNIEGSSVLIEHEDGRRWDVSVQGGRKVVTQLR